MHVLITGGTGFIGQALIRSLLEDGHQVTVLSRSPNNRRGLPAEVNLVGWDAKTAEGWGHLVNEVDAIVNYAGQPLDGDSFFPRRWTEARKQEILNSRVNAGRAVTEAIRAADNKPSVLIQASAAGYYGKSGDRRVSATDAAGDDFQGQVCAAWEGATDEVEAMGVRRAITRTGLVMSMHPRAAFTRIILPFRLFAGGPLGSGQQWTPWIHLDDQVRAVRFLMENDGASGPYHLSAPNPVRNKEYAKVLGQIMKRPWFVPAPAFAFKLAFGEVADLVLDGWRMFPDKLQAAGFEFKFAELDAAIRDLLGK